MKKTIRLTESDLHRIVRESVDSILNEVSFDKYNQMVDNARINAKERYRRAAKGKFTNPEEQEKYVNDRMSGFEGRVDKLADLYNSYGERRKPNAPQYDFRLNGPMDYGKEEIHDRYITRKGMAPQRAGGVTLRGDEGDVRYFPGEVYDDTITGNFSNYPKDGKVPESWWLGSHRGDRIPAMFSDNGSRLTSTVGMRPSDKEALGNVRSNVGFNRK